MAHILQRILALVLSVAHLAMLPGAALTATAANAQASASQQVLGGLYNMTSPDFALGVLYTSGSPTQADASMSAIYASQPIMDSSGEGGSSRFAGWDTPQLVFSLKGYHVGDPSVVQVYAGEGPGSDLDYMFYTKIADTDTLSTTTLSTRNTIGLAESHNGTTWQDMGTVIGQDNGLDARGGWAPSALMVQGEIWVYYSTNDPGPIAVYRSRFDTSGKRLDTQKVYLDDNNTEMPLSGFNVDVTSHAGGYALLMNTDLQHIVRYTSTDGIHWKTGSIGPSYPDENPIITANSGSVISAPASVSSADNSFDSMPIYFAAGSLANGRLDSIQMVPSVFGNPATYAYEAQAGSPSDTSSSSGGSGSVGVLLGIGLLGIAGILGLSAATGAAGTAAAAAREGVLKSFGGRIVSINYGPSCIYFSIIPAGVFPTEYIWTPATITYPAGPPNHLGQDLLGLALPAIIPCVGFGTHPPIWFGQDVFLIGTSPI